MADVRKIGRASAEVLRARRRRFCGTRLRELKMIGKALVSTKHPILVHIIPMRRCNLDCGYCNEYDDVSKPVPLEEMKRRLDILADMGTSIITISGGEPLMHPELEEVIRHIRKRGMIARDDHQRIFAEQGAHRAAERRGLGAFADQHRQRDAGRGVEEEFEDAG